MPKKGHSSRGGGGVSKKPTLVAANANPDESFIVFTNDKGPSKSLDCKPKASLSGESTTKAGSSEEAPKRPDSRTLIGGASWTGKLPMNLLAEHCQKQKWEKPEYTMSKTPDGFSSMVILKATNTKTRETMTLPSFKLPPTHKHLAIQATAVEARHFAATYALFRVSSMKNIHMMLPPTYRDLWKGDFADLKKGDQNEGKAWMYEADPFQAQKEREDARLRAAKNREEKQVQRDKEATLPLRPNGSSALGSHGDGRGGHEQKRWAKVPKVEMGKRTRTRIEDLIRSHAVWNPHNVTMIDSQRSRLMEDLSKLGFRKRHVEEASWHCKDREETLEWLLIHVPEDDLPPWSLPENYAAGISLASGNLKREGIVKRLAAAGYATELCEKILEMNEDDESRAAEALQKLLVKDVSRMNTEPLDSQVSDPDVWDEELNTLEAIFADRFTIIQKDLCQTKLTAPNGIQEVTLQVRKPATASYPHSSPTIAVLSEPPLPAYIRLSVLRAVVKHVESELLGEQMIFSIVDWLESNMPGLVEDPGPLRDIAAAASVGEQRSVTVQRQQVTRNRKPGRHIDWRPATTASLRMLSEWEARQSSHAQQTMLKTRRSLPAWELRETIVDTVNANQVTIISGETGSGKSTQSVQFVLDDLIQQKMGAAANLVCTQPRRISALGLADRVSDERCGRVGGEVGYTIRGESRQTPGITKITFVTTGVLLRRLQTSGGSSDDVLAALADISHVVVDEVHERSLDTDFLLVLLRDVLRRRKDLKVILMSATLDASIFERYFSGTGRVGRVEIQGRTYPVEDFYLDDVIRRTGFTGSNYSSAGRYESNERGDDDLDGMDAHTAKIIQGLGHRINYDLIYQLVKTIHADLGHEEGAILIFLPGAMEISRTIDTLRSISDIHALPLHASLLAAEQRRVFPPAPRGKRKVIAATNVAETSITIEDVVAVIDTGRVKETTFDPHNNMVRLEEVWASRAACKQRRGRAGRVRAGECYKLYTRKAEMMKMSERPEPEIRRVPLEQLCLSVKAMGVNDVPAFLQSALTPPESTAVAGALKLLGRIGALDGMEMTALGRHLSMIPADLRCGKLMVYGVTFGCLEACLTIAAILTVKSPFVSPQPKREESKAARVAFARDQGDLLGDLRAFETWSEMRSSHPAREVRMWCDENFLSFQTLNDISSNRSQCLSSLKEIGFVAISYHHTDSTRALYNRHNDHDVLIRALVAGAFHPQIARIGFPDKKFAASMSGTVELDPEARTIKYFNEENGRVFVHPSSTLFDAQTFAGNAVYMSYFNKMATSKVFIRDLTPFNAYTLLLFAGDITLDTSGRGLTVDGWLHLRGWARIGVLVSRLRMMLDEVLAQKIDDPGMELEGNEVVDVVRRLVELDGMDQ
ncbi:MAG: hypothetical protein M1817_003539 [Caeruleum heppii]|nr:MAG: hypothetical protein M1817_003539 [Caeruleum heppii]